MAKKATETPSAEELNNHFAEFLGSGQGDMAGFEDLGTDTMAVPFIKLLQDLSPQCKKSSEDYNPDAEPGQFCNTITGKLYETPMKFVVGKFTRIYTEWKPNRGGFQGSHAPELVEKMIASGELAPNEKNKLVSIQTGNEFSENYVYYVLLPDHLEDEVCVLSFSSTQLKAARKLNRALSTTYIPGTKQKAMPYFMIWELSTVLRSNDQGDWYSPVITMHSFVNQELLGHVVEERKQLPEKRLDMSLLEDKSAATSDAGAEQSDAAKF